MIQLVADIFGTIGMGYFLWAEIHQWRKIKRVKISDGISLHAYRNKVIAIIATCTCFGLSGLWLSFLVLAMEGIVVTDILRFIYKWRTKQ